MAKSHKTYIEQAEIIDTFGTYHALRLTDDARAPTTKSTAAIDAVATRAATLRAGRDCPPNPRLHVTRDRSGGPSAWKSSITRASKKAVRAPSQVFVAEADAPAANGKGEDDDSN